MSLRHLAAACLLATSSLSVFASKWEDMDYGRFLSATFNNPEGKSTLNGKGCASNKGIAVKLGEKEAAQLFDTETVRMAGGWTGGWVKLKGVAFDGGHGPNPSPADGADVFFQNNPGPGWSKGADFTDPRKLPTGPGAANVPFGPIPRDWAKYKGLYLNGDQVVFAYTVGTAEILEMPAIERVGDVVLLTRTFNVLAPGAGASVKVADAQKGGEIALADGVATLAKDGAKKTDNTTFAALAGATAGGEMKSSGGTVFVQLAQLSAGQRFKIAYAHGPAADSAKLTAALKSVSPAADLAPLTKGGPAHWKQSVETAGTLGNSDGKFPYVVDNLSVPLDNPYKSWIRVGGLDFFKDGRIAFSTWSGDVWIGSGVDDKLAKITWHRYATGLFHALGLKIVDDVVYVLGRDQITRLHDLNGDGEADYYENFNNDVQVTPGFHEFTFDLQTDSQGNFFFLKGGPVNPGGRGWGPLSDHNGCIFKVSKDGGKFEVFATGLRAPNGMGVGPNDEITTGDNQGTWVPVDYIHFAKPGEFIEVPDLAHTDTPPTKYATHLCWVPYDLDNSNGAQVWVTSDKWGPLKGRMLYLSYGKSALFSVLDERVGDVAQGGLIKFPLKFETGIMRARFSPLDGQLYVGGLRGWQTNGAKDGAIQRVRYTGKPLTIQTSLNITDKGIRIGFSNPVDAASAGDIQNYSIQQYNYRWTAAYGSAEYKVSDPEQKGRDNVDIKSVQVAPDKLSVMLEVPDLKPVMQMRIKMSIKSEDGAEVPGDIGNTINVVPPAVASGKNYISGQSKAAQ